jgi:hypothetical protein
MIEELNKRLGPRMGWKSQLKNYFVERVTTHILIRKLHSVHCEVGEGDCGRWMGNSEISVPSLLTDISAFV